jgi:peptidoglycan/LPS O-acetylase OafA/YrhL
VNRPGVTDGRHQFVLLDGLRGVAALAVVVTHALYFFPPTPMAYLAVDFFFMLSGFVLAHAYGERLRQGMTAGRFMAIRLIRLYPLYALGSALYLPFLWRGIESGTISTIAGRNGYTHRNSVPAVAALRDVLSVRSPRMVAVLRACGQCGLRCGAPRRHHVAHDRRRRRDRYSDISGRRY